jgi:putative SOS response-associated peptidase YedK
LCGRYTYVPKEFSELRIRWKLDRDLPLLKPRYNIAPSQDAPVIVSVDGVRSGELFQWGLVPWWAKDPSIGNQMINARAETLATKAAFKDLVGQQRCLVLADGFYEWRKEGKRKVPMRFKLKTGEPFAFAGLWDSWRKPDGKRLQTFTIITTEPNEVLRPVHNRMPVVLNDEAALTWLNYNGSHLSLALSVLKPFPAELMEGYDVSPLVNDPRNDSLDCVAPYEEPARFL